MARATGDIASDLALLLYRIARERSVDEFQEAALQLVKSQIRFAGAVWGTGELTEPGIAVHGAHLHHVAPEELADWQVLNPQDKVIPAVVARLGHPQVFQAPTLFAARNEAPMREFAKRAGWQSAMVTGFGASAQKNFQWISLYRPDPNHYYSEQERRLARALMPHLVEALTVNRLLQMHAVYAGSGETQGFLGFCDCRGLLCYADSRLLDLFAGEWPGWTGGLLPTKLRERVLTNRDTAFVGRTIHVETRITKDVVFLRARRRSKADRLSPRELDIARRFGQGFSHKEIARQLNLAAATVRHHLSRVYVKLEVHDKAQLANRLRQ